MSRRSGAASGVLYGLACYGFWGFVALYFKAVAHVGALEILAHRVVWSAALLLGWLGVRRRLPDLRRALADRRTLRVLIATTILIAVNWLTFIWAVANDRVLQCSLGYFINPLVNVLLGFVFLGERLRRLQTTSVLLAAAGVLWLTIGYGRIPLVALTLAFSFGFYGLLRKRADADAVVGLTAETLLLLPLCLGWLAWLQAAGALDFAHLDRTTDLLLIAAGAVTALPLIWFAKAARRLRLSTVGFLQYLAPTLQFLLAVVVFDEAFTRTHLISFACIWTALALYSVDALGAARRRTQPA